MMSSKVGSVLLGIAFAVAVVLGVRMMFGQTRTEKLPAPAVDEQSTGHSETAPEGRSPMLGLTGRDPEDVTVPELARDRTCPVEVSCRRSASGVASVQVARLTSQMGL